MSKSAQKASPSRRTLIGLLAAFVAAGGFFGPSAQSTDDDWFRKAAVVGLNAEGDAFVWDGDLTFAPDIYDTGFVKSGSIARLQHLVDQNPGIGKLILRSNGGIDEVGLALGQIVLRHHLDVYIHDYCYSSCANFAAVAAHRLYVPEGAVLGYHGAWAEKTSCQKEREVLLAARAAAKNFPPPPGAKELPLAENARQNVRHHNSFVREQRRFFKATGVDPCLLKCLTFLAISPRREIWMFSQDALVGCFGFRNIADYPDGLSRSAPHNVSWRTRCPDKGV